MSASGTHANEIACRMFWLSQGQVTIIIHNHAAMFTMYMYWDSHQLLIRLQIGVGIYVVLTAEAVMTINVNR